VSLPCQHGGSGGALESALEVRATPGHTNGCTQLCTRTTTAWPLWRRPADGAEAAAAATSSRGDPIPSTARSPSKHPLVAGVLACLTPGPTHYTGRGVTRAEREAFNAASSGERQQRVSRVYMRLMKNCSPYPTASPSAVLPGNLRQANPARITTAREEVLSPPGARSSAVIAGLPGAAGAGSPSPRGRAGGGGCLRWEAAGIRWVRMLVASPCMTCLHPHFARPGGTDR